MRTRAMAAAVAAGMLCAGTATAERLVRGVTDVTPTADGRGGSAILFRWDPAVGDGDVAVRRAVLRFALSETAPERTLTVRVHPVTGPWTDGRGAVSFDAELWSHAEIDLSRSGTVVVDVTDVVKEIVEEDLATHGFLLRADAGTAEGLTQGDLARLSGLASGAIEVTWRKVPPRPRGARGE